MSELVPKAALTAAELAFVSECWEGARGTEKVTDDEAAEGSAALATAASAGHCEASETLLWLW